VRRFKGYNELKAMKTGDYYSIASYYSEHIIHSLPPQCILPE
jgi:hypothetical protein